MNQFDPSRLFVARTIRHLNKKQLAEQLGVEQHTVTRWEKGTSVPSEESLISIATFLKFPLSFFKEEELSLATVEQTSFRKQSKTTAGVRDASLSNGALGFLVSDWLDQEFDLPAVDLPDLSHFTPQVAARTLRERWTLGEIPISNMIHLLESRGVRVFSLSEDTATVNAFAVWRDKRPFVFLNNFKSAESSRFDAAHELGHLVLHQDVKAKGRYAEDQANQFASSFLMPRSDVLANIPNNISLQGLIVHKLRWKVSLAALARRCHKLGLLSDWKYRDFCIQMGKKGYRTQEPDEVERESSLIWEKVLKVLWSEQQSHSVIAKATHIPEEQLEKLLFGILPGPSVSRDASKPNVLRSVS